MGSKSKSSIAPSTMQVAGTPQASFQQYYNKMPASYFSNAPIRDPSAILNAYMQYMPKVSAQEMQEQYNPGQAGNTSIADTIAPGKSVISKIAQAPLSAITAPVKLFRKIF